MNKFLFWLGQYAIWFVLGVFVWVALYSNYREHFTDFGVKCLTAEGRITDTFLGFGGRCVKTTVISTELQFK